MVTVLRWGSYNFYNCFEMLCWPKGEEGDCTGKKTPQGAPSLHTVAPGEAALVEGGPALGGGGQALGPLDWVSAPLSR